MQSCLFSKKLLLPSPSIKALQLSLIFYFIFNGVAIFF
ncbi:hypothetical protein P20311_1252 [Pseudoalteromonas sp. BSi20311]|nr:hypothetical protein P20311_1252 [Pseudoalteromonas sp. BSi20311]